MNTRWIWSLVAFFFFFIFFLFGWIMKVLCQTKMTVAISILKNPFHKNSSENTSKFLKILSLGFSQKFIWNCFVFSVLRKKSEWFIQNGYPGDFLIVFSKGFTGKRINCLLMVKLSRLIFRSSRKGWLIRSRLMMHQWVKVMTKMMWWWTWQGTVLWTHWRRLTDVPFR